MEEDVQTELKIDIKKDMSTNNTLLFMEQWSNLRFLGLAAWWGWKWLCYNSIGLMDLYPFTGQTTAVFNMYLYSTLAIGFAMLFSAKFWRRVTFVIDNKTFVLIFGLIAAVSTVFLGFSYYCGKICFFIAGILSGIGTAALCLKVGQVYGQVSLRESLIAGAISLIVAALFYFTGIALSNIVRIFYISLLPIVSAVFLNMQSEDQMEGFDKERYLTKSADSNSKIIQIKPTERNLLLRIICASTVVAFIAGIEKGISSSFNQSASFLQSGMQVTAAVVFIAILIILAINRLTLRKAVYNIYTGVMLLGVAILLASSYGFSMSYFGICKEVLWLVLFCLIAYIAFRFDYPPVLLFSISLAAYFIFSLGGWAVGYYISFLYSTNNIFSDVTNVLLAFILIFTLVYIFNGKDLSKITAPRNYKDLKNIAPKNSEVQVSTDTPFVQQTDLTNREIEVMNLFAQGHSASWIADHLSVSTSTVRSHIRSIYNKIDVHSRDELKVFLQARK